MPRKVAKRWIVARMRREAGKHPVEERESVAGKPKVEVENRRMSVIKFAERKFADD